MPHQVRVLIRQPECGQQAPIETANGHVIGWTQWVEGYGYCYEFASVDEFNKRAKELFDAQRPPGFQYIPHVIVECGSDEQPSDRLALLEEANAALQAENQRLTEALAEATRPAVVQVPDFRERVRLERAELDDRLTKLQAFFDNAIFKSLPEDEQERLKSQAVAMRSYLEVLTARIAAFDQPVTPTTSPATDAPRAPAEAPAYDYAAKIREKLATKNYRVPNLAEALEILPSDLQTFLAGEGCGFHITPQGWVKEGPAPA